MTSNFTIIDKSIKDYNSGKNRNQDIFVYAYIKLCSDFKSGLSHATQDRLSELTGIPLRTLQEAIYRLRDSSFMSVVTKQVEKSRKQNTYIFNPQPINYYLLDNSFFYLSLTPKQKGFLLLLKCLCLNNTNKTLFNRTKIASELFQDRGTVSKLINELVAKELIHETKEGYLLPTNFFPFFSKSKKSQFEDFQEHDLFILEAILDLCNEKHAILFVPDTTPLKRISVTFPLKEKDAEKLKEDERLKFYLPAILKYRCPTLPSKIESLSYFLRVLNIEFAEYKNIKTNIIL